MIDDLRRTAPDLPDWVPSAVKSYMAHTKAGHSIRALARGQGCHASTILRQVRRTEQRRDDLLVDLALDRLERRGRLGTKSTTAQETAQMNATAETLPPAVDDETLEREARRILRRLNEPGACLAMAREMEKAVVVRDAADGQTLRTAVVDAPVAEAFALKDWIEATGQGRIVRYRITQPGRMALKRLLAEEEARQVSGHGEETSAFAAQHGSFASKTIGEGAAKRRVKYSTTESPLVLLSRRKDKDGKPFLSSDLVSAGERLREDFELAQMGPRTTQNWEKFLTAGVRTSSGQSGVGGGSEAARTRVQKALEDLGPGLGDVVLRACCFLEGMEAVEQRMGWSARSGKIVLRIALTRLKRHYEEGEGDWSPLIG